MQSKHQEPTKSQLGCEAGEKGTTLLRERITDEGMQHLSEVDPRLYVTQVWHTFGSFWEVGMSQGASTWSDPVLCIMSESRIWRRKWALPHKQRQAGCWQLRQDFKAYSEEWHPDMMDRMERRPLLTIRIGAIDHKSISRPLWLFLAVLGCTLLLQLLCPCAMLYNMRKTLLSYPPFGGSWMGSLGTMSMVCHC